MRPLSRLLLASLTTLVLIAAACAGQQKTETNKPDGREANSTVEEIPNEGGAAGGEQAGAQQGPALKTIEAPEGFTVSIPGEPQIQRNKVTIPAGEVATAAFTSNVDGVIYSISTADYPEKVVAARPAEAFLNEGRDGLVNQLKGTLKDEQAITIDSYPGKSYTVSSDNGEVKARNFLVGPRLYTLLVLYNPSIGAPAADGFLTSLKLVNPPPPVQRASASASGGTDGGTAMDGGDTGAADAGTAPDAGAPRRRRAK
jgi:hypothetical protein